MATTKCAVDLSGDGGVLKTMIRSCSAGAAVKSGDIVHVHYVGHLVASGEEFDSSGRAEFGDTYAKPLRFIAGKGQVVRGFDLAVLSMRVGETSSTVMRADYAYGDTGAPGRGMAPDISPGDALEFELELMSIEEDVPVITAEDERRKKLEELRAERAQAAKEKQERDAQRKKREAAAAKAKMDKRGGKGKGKIATSVDAPLDTKAVKKMNPKALKQQLKARGLPIQGSKKVLQARLLAAMKG